MDAKPCFEAQASGEPDRRLKIEELLKAAQFLLLMIGEYEIPYNAKVPLAERAAMRARHRQLRTEAQLRQISELLLSWRAERDGRVFDVRAAAAASTIASEYRALKHSHRNDATALGELIRQTLQDLLMSLPEGQIGLVRWALSGVIAGKGDGGIKGRVATTLRTAFSNITASPRSLESLMAALQGRRVRAGAIRHQYVAEAFRDDLGIANLGEGRSFRLAIRVISPWLGEDAIMRLVRAWQAEATKYVAGLSVTPP